MEEKKVPGEETRSANNLQEKTSLGTDPKAGATSRDPKKKEEMEKKGTLAEDKSPKNDLSKEDIPDSTNESTGVPGSGQRQDSN